jgi:hypothetical protein
MNRTIQVGLMERAISAKRHARAALAIPGLGIAAIYGSNPEKELRRFAR